jgi:hypothetical protein
MIDPVTALAAIKNITGWISTGRSIAGLFESRASEADVRELIGSISRDAASELIAGSNLSRDHEAVHLVAAIGFLTQEYESYGERFIHDRFTIAMLIAEIYASIGEPSNSARWLNSALVYATEIADQERPGFAGAASLGYAVTRGNAKQYRKDQIWLRGVREASKNILTVAEHNRKKSPLAE